jgi:hypothetical protein
MHTHAHSHTHPTHTQHVPLQVVFAAWPTSPPVKAKPQAHAHTHSPTLEYSHSHARPLLRAFARTRTEATLLMMGYCEYSRCGTVSTHSEYPACWKTPPRQTPRRGARPTRVTLGVPITSECGTRSTHVGVLRVLPMGYSEYSRWGTLRCSARHGHRARRNPCGRQRDEVVPQVGSPPAHICAGMGSPPAHICAGTGLTPRPHLRWDLAHPLPTSAPGPGSQPHQDWAHPAHIGTSDAAII